MAVDNQTASIQDLMQEMRERADPVAALKEQLLIALLMRCLDAAGGDDTLDFTVDEVNRVDRHFVHLEILDGKKTIRLRLSGGTDRED